MWQVPSAVCTLDIYVSVDVAQQTHDTVLFVMVSISKANNGKWKTHRHRQSKGMKGNYAKLRRSNKNQQQQQISQFVKSERYASNSAFSYPCYYSFYSLEISCCRQVSKTKGLSQCIVVLCLSTNNETNKQTKNTCIKGGTLFMTTSTLSTGAESDGLRNPCVPHGSSVHFYRFFPSFFVVFFLFFCIFLFCLITDEAMCMHQIWATLHINFDARCWASSLGA